MRRGTTPTIRIKVNGIPLDSLETVHVTFRQYDTAITKTQDDFAVDTEENTITVTLTQEETLAFKVGDIGIQLRGATAGGVAVASTIEKTIALQVLERGIIA